MGDTELSGGFDPASTGQKISKILDKPTVNLTDEARDRLKDQILRVGERVATTQDTTSLVRDLTTLHDACCIFNPDDKALVRTYLDHLEM